MKTVLTVVFLIIIGKMASAQTDGSLPDTTGTFTVNASQKELFLRAKEYLAKNTKIKQDQVTLADTAAGTLIANTVCHAAREIGTTGIKVRFLIKFNTSIAVKDNKFKYSIQNIQYDKSASKSVESQTVINNVVTDLVKALSNKSTTEF